MRVDIRIHRRNFGATRLPPPRLINGKYVDLLTGDNGFGTYNRRSGYEGGGYRNEESKSLLHRVARRAPFTIAVLIKCRGSPDTGGIGIRSAGKGSGALVALRGFRSIQ